MRARRPELFSDSQAITEFRLTRGLLEYHLDTLTNRKQETEFEHFARRLAEKEICPNLIPQTGPTGGGDSKTDTETYPVSEAISERWYHGIGQEARDERWAFAFSAKKKWKTKVQNDIEKIAGTNRDYKRIFFITNQYVRDQDRANTEDDLTRKYNIPVRIFDRNWILEKIFTNNRQVIAIECLHLTDFESDAKKKAGPRDIQRATELRELDARISDPDRYQGTKYQLAEDCLHSAELARGIELPREEVDGRFLRAERIAEKENYTPQRLRIAYAKAWTAFNWYNDFAEFNKLYTDVEFFAERSAQASDIKLLVNLWLCLKTAIISKQLEVEATDLLRRTEKLKGKLDHLASDQNRPNNSLQARTDRLLIYLHESIELRDQAGINKVLGELKTVLDSAEHLGAFPVENLKEIIFELGNFLPDNASYDDLYEHLVSLLGKRVSEGESGCALLDRGYQIIKAEKYYDAIRLFGRAQDKLIKQEYRDQLSRALFGCGAAYAAVDLLWAARTNVLTCVAQLYGQFQENGVVPNLTLSCAQRLIWLELQLGRVPCVLCWIELADVLAVHLGIEDEQRDSFERQRDAQDKTLGLLLLMAPLEDLRKLAFLPEVLKQRSLYQSYIAILYALGYESILREEGCIPQEKSPELILAYFEDWINQPVKNQLPARPILLAGAPYTFFSCVLGSKIIVNTAQYLSSIQLAEAILSALEALLTTSIDRAGLWPYRQELHLNIEPSHDAIEEPQFQIEEREGDLTIEVRHPPQFSPISVDARLKLKKWILELIVHILPRFIVGNGMRDYIESLIQEENVLSRSLTFSEVAICISNILGDSPKLLLSDWANEPHVQDFPPMREIPWFTVTQRTTDDQNSESARFKLGDGPPPPELLLELKSAKHGEHHIASLIDIPLWDRAKWTGTAYGCTPGMPPLLCIVFQDKEAGQAIFQTLRKRLGEVDFAEELRISIITGINRSRPFEYAVVLGSNLNIMNIKKGFLMTTSRINRMDNVRDPRNLNTFLERYQSTGKFLVAPAAFIDPLKPPQLFVQLAIKKTELHVRPAWQIDENDPDLFALRSDDDPVIPDGETNPPVYRALDKIRSRHKKKN